MKTLSKLRDPRTLRYVSIGVAIYIVELLIITIAQRLGASAFVAVAWSFWIGLILSFILQKFLTFKDNRTHHKILLPQIIAVIALVIFNFGFTLLCVKLLRNLLPTFIIRGGAIAITTIWNFYLYRTRIFNQPGLLLVE